MVGPSTFIKHNKTKKIYMILHIMSYVQFDNIEHHNMTTISNETNSIIAYSDLYGHIQASPEKDFWVYFTSLSSSDIVHIDKIKIGGKLE